MGNLGRRWRRDRTKSAEGCPDFGQRVGVDVSAPVDRPSSRDRSETPASRPAPPANRTPSSRWAARYFGRDDGVNLFSCPMWLVASRDIPQRDRALTALAPHRENRAVTGSDGRAPTWRRVPRASASAHLSGSTRRDACADWIAGPQPRDSRARLAARRSSRDVAGVGPGRPPRAPAPPDGRRRPEAGR